MTKNSKKLVSIFIALIMVLTIFPISSLPTFAFDGGDMEAIFYLLDNTELRTEDGMLFNGKLEQYGASSLEEFLDNVELNEDYGGYYDWDTTHAPVFQIYGDFVEDWSFNFDITLNTNDFSTADKIASAKIEKVEFLTVYYGDVDDHAVYYPVTPAHTHNSNAYGSNATQHWTKCTDDEENNGTPVNHTWSNGKCSVCQYTCAHTGMTADDAACATCSMANPNYVAPVQEKSVTITADESGAETYTRAPITIVTKGGDSDGGECMKDKPITISASGSNKITKVEITVGYKAGNASPKFAATAGKIQTPYSTDTGSKITITDIDNATVKLTNSDDGLWQLIAFQVYYTAPAHTHNSNAYGSNATQHWTKCTDDNDNNGTAVNHTWENGKCSVCQYTCTHTGMTTDNATCGTCGIANPDYVQGADYSAVDAAIASIPSDLTIYTDATVAAVNAAVNAVVEGKTIDEQAAVDAMAAAINTAVAALALKDADYSAVEVAKANIPSDLTIYTDATVAAVNAAVNAVVEGKKIDEQAAVDAMATAINTAVAALALKDADYSAVTVAKANIPSDLTIYTDATVAAVNAAVNAVVEGKKIDEQAAVDAMAAAINDAVAALALKDADYSAVEAAKANIPSDLSIYSDATVAAVTAAVNAVVEGKKITEQAEVDAMAQAIEDAIAALRFAEVVKDTKIEIAAEEDEPNFEAVTDEGIKVEGNFVAATEDEPAGFMISGDDTDCSGTKSLTFTAPEGWVIVGLNYDVVYVKSNDTDVQECGVLVTGHEADVLSMDAANLHFEKSFLGSAPAPKMAPRMLKAAPKAAATYGEQEVTIEVNTNNAKCLLNNAEVILARIGENIDVLPTAVESAFSIIEHAKEAAKSEAAKAIVVPEDAFEAATTVEEVNAIMGTYLAIIALADAKAEAIEALQALVADEKATDKMKAIANEGIEAVNAATSIDEVKLLLKDYTAKVNAENEKENVKDESCKNPVSGICLTYSKYANTPVLGIILGFVHQIVHFFHADALV